MADAGIKPTSKVYKNCAVFGSYDEMILLIVRIIDHPKQKLDYNMDPVYHAVTLWFHHTSRKWQCQLFVILNKKQKQMDNLIGAFTQLCSQHKDAVNSDSVDTERKKSAQKSLSVMMPWRILKSNADMVIMTAVKSVAENPQLGERSSRDYVVVSSFQSYQSLSLQCEIGMTVCSQR